MESADRRPVVLVVDDEQDVREMIREILRYAGMDSLLAAEGGEALELLRAQAGRVDLVLTDVMMPGVDGATLARAIAREWPGIPVLFMTGYLSEALASRGLLAEDVPRIEKPFQVRSLVERIREAMAPPAG